MTTVIEIVPVTVNLVEHTTINGKFLCFFEEWHLELERWWRFDTKVVGYENSIKGATMSVRFTHLIIKFFRALD